MSSHIIMQWKARWLMLSKAITTLEPTGTRDAIQQQVYLEEVLGMLCDLDAAYYGDRHPDSVLTIAQVLYWPFAQRVNEWRRRVAPKRSVSRSS